MRARAAAEKREAVDVKADDFDGVSFYVCVIPEQKEVLRVSLFAPCFAEIKDSVGDAYFAELYAFAGVSLEVRCFTVRLVKGESSFTARTISSSSSSFCANFLL